MLVYSEHMSITLLLLILKKIDHAAGCSLSPISIKFGQLTTFREHTNTVLAHGIYPVTVKAMDYSGLKLSWNIGGGLIGYCTTDTGITNVASNYSVSGTVKSCSLDFAKPITDSIVRVRAVDATNSKCWKEMIVATARCNNTSNPQVNATGNEYGAVGKFYCLNQGILLNKKTMELADDDDKSTTCTETAEWRLQETVNCLEKSDVSLSSNEEVIHNNKMSVVEGETYAITCRSNNLISASLLVAGTPYKTSSTQSKDAANFEVSFRRNQNCVTIKCSAYTLYTKLRSDQNYTYPNITSAGDYQLDVKYGPKDFSDTSCESSEVINIKFTFSMNADILDISIAELPIVLNWTASYRSTDGGGCEEVYYHVYHSLTKAKLDEIVPLANISFRILNNTQTKTFPLNVTKNCWTEKTTFAPEEATTVSVGHTKVYYEGLNCTKSASETVPVYAIAVIGTLIGLNMLLTAAMVILWLKYRQLKTECGENKALDDDFSIRNRNRGEGSYNEKETNSAYLSVDVNHYEETESSANAAPTNDYLSCNYIDHYEKTGSGRDEAPYETYVVHETRNQYEEVNL